jgi:hypothetical protein
MTSACLFRQSVRERLGRLIKHELNRENDVNAVVTAIELRRLVAVAIKPFSHCGHLAREIRRGKPNLHDPHEFASQAIARYAAETGRRASRSIGSRNNAMAITARLG